MNCDLPLTSNSWTTYNTAITFDVTKPISANLGFLEICKPKFVLSFHGEGKLLATLHTNGHVTMDESNANAVAKLFWESIQLNRPRCPNCNSDVNLV